MNKSVVLWFELLSKRFGSGPSLVELQVRYNRCKVCIKHARGLEETEVGV